MTGLRPARGPGPAWPPGNTFVRPPGRPRMSAFCDAAAGEEAPPPPPPARCVDRSERMTWVNGIMPVAGIQCARVAGSQTSPPRLPGCLYSPPSLSAGERVVVARPYTRTSSVVEAARERAARALQRRWRGIRGRLAARAAQRAAESDLEAAVAERRRQAEAASAALAARSPRQALEATVAAEAAALGAEAARIARDVGMEASSRKSLLLNIVAHEASLAHDACAARRTLRRASARESHAARLAAATAPYTQERSDGGGSITVQTQVHELAAWKARVHGEAAASAHGASPGNTRRLAFLEDALALVAHEQQHSCAPRVKATLSSLASLCTRETDLLARGRPLASLAGLQERIKALVDAATDSETS